MTQQKDIKEEAVNEDLFVFGYACKLFRDDEKAIYIDNCKHLIPWMSDDGLMIDRYDGRGALYDLKKYEPEEGLWDQLLPEELELEKECDLERYRALYLDDCVEMMGLKERKIGSYGEVPFTYEENNSSNAEIGPQVENPIPQIKKRQLKPFQRPPDLQEFPTDMQVPETMKQHFIIARTAAFIVKQGTQMEIIMKIKQADNTNFNFLSHNDALYPYYKFVLSCVKEGSYKPKEEEEEEELEEGEDYLHPSLSSKSTQDDFIPSENLKQIIEIMIKYLTKNGPAFEKAIKKLNDERFDFLEPTNPGYRYYREQADQIPKPSVNVKTPSAPIIADTKQLKLNIEQSLKTLTAAVKEIKSRKSPEKKEVKTVKKRFQPVSFSIKKPKEDESLDVKSALPIEESSDDNGEDKYTMSEGESSSRAESKERRSKRKSSRRSSDISDEERRSRRKERKKRRSSGSGSKKSKKKKSSSKDKIKEKDSDLQKERKLKVAKFLKGLKTKGD